ncbi:MAG: hypothetical protein AB8A46_06120 [Prochlorococcus sp.]|jgi:hypothetical protein|nr:hypothetical protein [Prochlorococcus sp.]CAI8172776.1 MAG: Uncharacterised protein [Prochlorococcus marinus str. MIT 9215]
MPEPLDLYVLLAPEGQLSGHGQLRETIRERRKRLGEDVPFWYLSPQLVKAFKLSEDKLEAVVAKDSIAIDWLQLRFGGNKSKASLDIAELQEKANALPPKPTYRDLSS